MRLFEWWGIPRRGWFIILAELFAIIGLSGWVVTEYLNNIYFQSYVNGLAPVLVPVLSVAFGVASASAATILYFGMKNLRRPGGTMNALDQSKKKAQAKKSVKHVAPAEVKASKIVASPSIPAPRLKPIAPLKTSTTREASTRPVEKKERP